MSDIDKKERVMLITASVGLAVNAALAVFLCTRKGLLKKKSNKFLLNVIISDAFVSFVIASTLLYNQLNIMADYELVIAITLTLSGLLHSFYSLPAINLVLLTLDRLIAITVPYFYVDTFRNKHVYFSIVAAWLLPITYCVTQGVMAAFHYFEVILSIYNKFISCVVLLVAGAILTVANIFIFVVARRQVVKISRLSVDQLNTHHLRFKREFRVVLFTLGLIVVHIACWMPSIIYSIKFITFDPATDSPSGEINEGLNAYFIIIISHLLNPLLYICMSGDIKAQIKKLFCRTNNYSDNNPRIVSNSYTLSSYNKKM